MVGAGSNELAVKRLSRMQFLDKPLDLSRPSGSAFHKSFVELTKVVRVPRAQILLTHIGSFVAGTSCPYMAAG
jgi:hypothetical protein